VCRYITGIHFTQKACPFLEESFYNNFPTSNYSNSEVNFEVSELKPDCALPIPEKGITFLQMDERCGRSVVAEEISLGLTFEPKCLVVVIRPDHRKALFDELLAAGRNLANPLEISVNYTVGLHSNPDVPSIESNCQNSLLMQDNYDSDKILQAEFSRLEAVREEIEKITALKNLLEYANSHQRFFQSPSPPPPPPPPPSPGYSEVDVEAGRLSPPGPPVQVTVSQRFLQLTQDIVDRKNEETSLLAEVSGCVGTRTRKCGLSVTEAPNPWIGVDGVSKCRGYDTRSSRFGDVCGYWDAATNPDGAPFDEKLELLKAGPWCYRDEDGDSVVECSSKADRTQRAGIWENKVCQFYNPHHAHKSLPWHTHTSSALESRCLFAHRDGGGTIGLTVAIHSSVLVSYPTNPGCCRRRAVAKCWRSATRPATLDVVNECTAYAPLLYSSY